MKALFLGMLAAAALVFVAVVAFSFVNTAASVVTAPGRVVQQTLQTDNIIQSYEQFYDLNEDYKRFVAQYETANSTVAEFEASAGPRENWTFEDKQFHASRVALRDGVRAKVNDIVARYNANSQKMNKTIFKGWDLPPELVQL